MFFPRLDRPISEYANRVQVCGFCDQLCFDRGCTTGFNSDGLQRYGVQDRITPSQPAQLEVVSYVKVLVSQGARWWIALARFVKFGD
jgi:hypothetical protein